MKPDEPSRTALMVVRQRAAHQLLDHGSILCDPFAMTILGEDASVTMLNPAIRDQVKTGLTDWPKTWLFYLAGVWRCKARSGVLMFRAGNCVLG